MSTFWGKTILFHLLLTSAVIFHAQEPQPTSRAMDAALGTVSGRVTVDGKAAPGIGVALRPFMTSVKADSLRQALTDEEGRFQFAGVPAGRFQITPLAAGFNLGNEPRAFMMGREVIVSGSETIDGIDFSLTSGGVVTGTVTESNRSPVIGEQVKLTALDEHDKEHPVYLQNKSMMETDDRGVYRLYNVPPGRYKVSVESGLIGGLADGGLAARSLPRVYHPGVSASSQAVVIEVKSGAEVTDVDIKMPPLQNTFEASGRILRASSGKPLANTAYKYAALSSGGGQVISDNLNLRTDAKGEFHIQDLFPGRYSITASFDGENELYCEPTVFEIVSEDVTGLEVKALRGSSISGTIVSEGMDAPALASKLSPTKLWMSFVSQSSSPPTAFPIPIGSDGSFKVNGLNPGTASIALNKYSAPAGYSLVRVERDGIAQGDGIRVSGEEEVTGVRVVLAYGTAVLHGQVNIQGGSLPQGSRLALQIRRQTNDAAQSATPVSLDAQRHFIVDELADADYELVLTAFLPSGTGATPRIVRVNQRLRVANGEAADIGITLDLAGAGKEPE